MSKTCDLSFVIPVYNEQSSLTRLVESIQSILKTQKKSAEIIFIDDGSTDRSPQLLKELQDQSSIKIIIIILRKNFGKSAALFAGIQKARGQIIVTLDADLQNDPQDLPSFLKAMDEGFDMVCGWRVNRQDPLEKRLPSKFFNSVTSKMSGLNIHDFNCGYKAYRREVLEEIVLYGDMHRYTPFLAHKRGFKVTEIPVTHHPRLHDSSKYRFERYARGALDLLTVLFLTTYLVRPMHLFGSIGVLTIFSGILTFIYLFFGRWIWGISIGSSPLLAVSFLAIAVGTQILVTGFLAELLVHWRKTLQPEFSIKKVED
ncbi:glycosyltransferase family 2 protein [Deltaproteobacteria bacterium TL4]